MWYLEICLRQHSNSVGLKDLSEDPFWYVVEVCKYSKKEYQVQSLGGQKAADYMDAQVKFMFALSFYADMGQILGMYEEETKSRFKFYKDGDIFTVVYSRETK